MIFIIEDEPRGIMNKNLIQFVKTFNHISIRDLEEILEYLEDETLLNKNGIKFRTDLWKQFIHDGTCHKQKQISRR